MLLSTWNISAKLQKGFTECFSQCDPDFVLHAIKANNTIVVTYWPKSFHGCMILFKENITYFLVVVRFPFMMRVEVETDLKLPIPPPMLSIPSRPPKDEEKEVNSTVKNKKKQEKWATLDCRLCLCKHSYLIYLRVLISFNLHSC